jgi:hypothetical protein
MGASHDMRIRHVEVPFHAPLAVWLLGRRSPSALTLSSPEDQAERIKKLCRPRCGTIQWTHITLHSPSLHDTPSTKASVETACLNDLYAQA